MVRGGCDAALTDLLLWERLFGGVGALFCDGFGFDEKPKSVLKLIFREGFLCFRQVLGMKSFTDLVRCRSRVDEGRQQGKCNSSDENQELSCTALHLIGGCAIVVPDLNVLRKQVDTLWRRVAEPRTCKS